MVAKQNTGKHQYFSIAHIFYLFTIIVFFTRIDESKLNLFKTPPVSCCSSQWAIPCFYYNYLRHECYLEMVKRIIKVGHQTINPTNTLKHQVNIKSLVRLSPQTESLVKIQYRRNVRQSSDPYKRAVYCIMAACDSQEEHGEIATSLGELDICINQINKITIFLQVLSIKI